MAKKLTLSQALILRRMGYIVPNSLIKLPRQKARLSTKREKPGWYGQRERHRVARIKRKVMNPTKSEIQKAKKTYYELLWEAQDYFNAGYSKNRLKLEEKYKDLMETSPDTRKPTKENIAYWKKHLRETDIEGVDTYNFNKAEALLSSYTPKKRGIVDSYINSDGDIKSFKTFDKPLKEAILDEIESNWKY